MNIKYQDFIGVFSGVYQEGFCKHLLDEFNRNQSLGAGSNRQDSEGALKHIKNDYQNLYGKITPEIKKRMSHELNVIKNMGFAGYFLITADFVEYAKKSSIP